MISQAYKQYLELQKHKAAIANVKAMFNVSKSIYRLSDDSEAAKAYLTALEDVNKMIDRIL